MARGAHTYNSQSLLGILVYRVVRQGKLISGGLGATNNDAML